MTSGIEHKDNGNAGAFCVPGEGKHLAELNYHFVDGIVVADHTFVDPSLRGSGMAGRLVEALVGWASERGHKIRPACPYIARVFDSDPARYAAVRAS